MCFALAEVENQGTLVCYKKDDRGYTRADSMAFDAGALCYIQYSPKHKILFGASYQTGHVMAVAIDNYKFAGIRSLFAIQPDDISDISRAHCCVPDNNEDRIFVCNISLDRVYGYNIENGTLKENAPFPYIQLDKGEGPRHIRFHPAMDIAYVITEYSNKLIALNYKRDTGALKVIQEISTLPEGFSKESYGSSLAISPDGKYLYAANRGANTIAVFGIDVPGPIPTAVEILKLLKQHYNHDPYQTGKLPYCLTSTKTFS
jgi:6-phosphogluconolactonase